MKTGSLITTVVAIVVIGGFLEAHEPVPRADFYVSPLGNDSWSGKLPEPNPQGTDGPFATLTRARDAVRQLKQTIPPRDIVVLIRGGIYRLTETVVFGPEDSGPDGALITYAAYPGETPVFTSGRPITQWRPAPRDLPGLPPKAVGHVWMAPVNQRFFTLYDDKGLLPRARSAGFVPLSGGTRNTLRFPPGTLKQWPHLDDVEIVIRPYHAWIVNILPLASVDEEKGIAQTKVSGTYTLEPLRFLPGMESCWVENVLEALDEPGEWVLDSKQSKLYLWPRLGSRPQNIVAPALRELVRIEGKIDELGPVDLPVRNLCFRGLTFMHGDRFCLTDQDAGLQHDWEVFDQDNALLRLRGAENCKILRCQFKHSGGGAIRVDLYGQQNEIYDNLIEHVGGTGILLCGYGPGTKDVNKNNVVSNNHIHHVGQIYLHSPGIMIWQSGNNRVANNLIHHTPYSGIILSGCMTHFFARPDGRELVRTIRWHEIGKRFQRPTWEQVRPYLHTRDNLVEYNEIHHVMEKLADGNGIYIRGAGPGNVIRRNYVHHLLAPTAMQGGIRTDGGQHDTLIAENVVYKCTAQGIILKLDNDCVNNFIVDVIAPPRGYYLTLVEGPMTGAVIQRNIFYCLGQECEFIHELKPVKGKGNIDRRGRILARSQDADTDYNIYYCKRSPQLAQEMLASQRKKGVDLHSLATDPLFVAPEKGDFRFRPNSPALKLGIVPIDLSKVGLRRAESDGHMSYH